MAISKVGLTTGITGTLPIANGGTGATSFSPGKVLQVVQGTTSVTHTTTSTTPADTGLTVDITPDFIKLATIMQTVCLTLKEILQILLQDQGVTFKILV
jgi:hypothetical protein